MYLQRLKIGVAFINTTNSACGISHVDNRYALRTTTIVVSDLAAFFLAIRVVSKITGPLSWGADDTLLALSSVRADDEKPNRILINVGTSHFFKHIYTAK